MSHAGWIAFMYVDGVVMLVLGAVLAFHYGPLGKLFPTKINALNDVVGTFMICMGVGTLIIASYVLIGTIADDWWRGVATGIFSTLLAFGAVQYVRGLFESQRVLKKYDESMLEMFNSVPQSQRFGFAEDLPKGTRFGL